MCTLLSLIVVNLHTEPFNGGCATGFRINDNLNRIDSHIVSGGFKSGRHLTDELGQNNVFADANDRVVGARHA